MFTIDKKTLKNDEYNINTNRIILHVDVNNAFLSWTADYLLKNGFKKDIRKVPSIISRYNDYRSGIVLAKSDIAKKYNIRTGEPVINAYKKCNNLEIYLSDYNLYKRKSKEIKKLLYSYTPIIEQYSIDEWFLDITNCLMGKNPLEIAYNIRNEIYEKIGVTVNIGVANSKILAKTASDFEKPFKVHTLFKEEIPKKLWPLDVSKLFLVGKKTEIHLNNMGIKTVYDLAHADKKRIRKKLGKNGALLVEYANGIDNSLVITDDKLDKRKSISKSQTFKEETIHKELILSRLIDFADEVSYILRKENLKASKISIYIKYYDFRVIKSNMNIPYTNSSNEIIKYARELFENNYVERLTRSVGIALSNLNSDNFIQNDIFTISENNILKENINNYDDNFKNNNLKNSNIKNNKNKEEILDKLKKDYNINRATHYINTKHVKANIKRYKDISFDGDSKIK